MLLRVCRLAVSALLFVGAAFAAEELLPGHWEGKPEGVESVRSYMFEVGPPTHRRFTFAAVAPNGFQTEVVASGTFEVTDDVEDHHLTLHVERIYQPESGQEQSSAEFAGWTLQTHEDAAVILREQGTDMALEALEPASRALLVRFRMRLLGAAPR